MRLTRPDPDHLYRLYVTEQCTVAQVATELGVAHGTAHNWLRQAAIPLRASPSSPTSTVDEAEIAELYGQGLSAPEIAARLGCGTSTVYWSLERRGLARRPGGPQPVRPPRARLSRLYLVEQFSLRHIAATYQVSPKPSQTGSGTTRSRPDPQPHQAPISTQTKWSPGYQNGLSGPQLASLHSCSTATIYRYLDHAGIARRTRPPALTRTILLAALDTGATATDIAGTRHVSVSAVCRALRREGLQTRRQQSRQAARRRIAALPTRA